MFFVTNRESWVITDWNLPGRKYSTSDLGWFTLPGRQYFWLGWFTLPGREYFWLGWFTLPGREYFWLGWFTLPGREYFWLGWFLVYSSWPGIIPPLEDFSRKERKIPENPESPKVFPVRKSLISEIPDSGLGQISHRANTLFWAWKHE